MSNISQPGWRFISFADAEVEKVPPGKTHHWYVKKGMVPDTNVLLVRARLDPGAAHKFHLHPEMEEILYILSGTAEQWVEREKKLLGPGDALFLPVGVIHGTYNIGAEPLEFLAVLTPAKISGPITVEVGDQEPWRSLKS